MFCSLITFLAGLSIVHAFHFPRVQPFYRRNDSLVLILNTGDGRLASLRGELNGNAYEFGSPDFLEPYHGSIDVGSFAGTLEESEIQLYSLLQNNGVYQGAYHATDAYWGVDVIDTKCRNIEPNSLYVSPGKTPGFSFFTTKTINGAASYGWARSWRTFRPDTCRGFGNNTQFYSVISHVTVNQADGTRKTHVVGLGSDKELIYLQIYPGPDSSVWDYNKDFFVKTDLSRGLKFTGTPMISRWSETGLDIWAITDSKKLVLSRFTEGQGWGAWQDLGPYESSERISIAYDSRKSIYVMGLDEQKHLYLYKQWTTAGGWSPGQKTWTSTDYNWLSPPVISSWSQGAVQSDDIHVFGITKDGNLTYSYKRGTGSWLPRNGGYYTLMNIPGMNTAEEAHHPYGPRPLVTQEELK